MMGTLYSVYLFILHRWYDRYFFATALVCVLSVCVSLSRSPRHSRAIPPPLSTYMRVLPFPFFQLTDNTAESRTSEALNTDLAAANPFGDSADVTEGDGGGADGGGADGEGSGDDEYEVETPLTNDLTDFDEAAAPPIPQRPESALLDAEDGVIGADGGMSL